MNQVVRCVSCLIILSATLLPTPTFATKCFVKSSFEGLKEVFPIVIKGRIVERKKVIGDHKGDS